MASKPKNPETRGRKARGGIAGTPVTVRLTPDEREQFEAAAEERSMSLAEWIRAACAAFLKRRK